jgi:hypothetical protein
MAMHDQYNREPSSQALWPLEGEKWTEEEKMGIYYNIFASDRST